MENLLTLARGVTLGGALLTAGLSLAGCSGGPDHPSQAQQRALSHQTSYATVALTILGPKAAPPARPAQGPPSVASALGAGWRA